MPIVNLALLFKAPQAPVEKSGALAMIGAIALVFLGIMFYGAGRAISTAVGRDADYIAQNAQQDPQTVSNLVDATVASDGIEAVLKASIGDIRVPMQVDKITTLSSVDVVGRTLHYGYTLSGDILPLSDANKSQIAKRFCTSDNLKPFIDAGATIRATYVDRNNVTLGEVNANTELCATASR